jgi:copper chaperone CopZ
MQTEVLDITGMTSEGCVAAVMRAIQSIEGVNSVSVSQNRAIVQFDADRTAPQEMGAALVKAGYGMRAITAEADGCGGCCGGCGGGKA